jgi:hypothetical protein
MFISLYSPPSDIPDVIHGIGKDIGVLFAPSLVIHQRRVDDILTGVAVDPALEVVREYLDPLNYECV